MKTINFESLKVHSPPISVGAIARYPYSSGLKAHLTIPIMGEMVCLAHQEGNTLEIPRELAGDGGEDYRVSYAPKPIVPKKPPRNDEQKKIISSSVEYLREGRSHILEAGTGTGKSYMGAAIASAMGQPTLIVVTKQDLMESWKRTLTDLIGVKETEIGILQADKKVYKGKRFVLGMIHSLVIPGKYDKEVLGSFGMMIVDEVHRVAADTFERVCRLIPARYRLGLSATPTRSDMKTPIINAHIGPVLIRWHEVPMKPKILVKQTGWRPPTYPNGKPMKITPGKMMGVYKHQGVNAPRNQIICDFVKSAYSKGRNTLILSDLVDGHLKVLGNMLINSGISPEDVGYYIGGMKQVELNVSSKKKVVLATYGMCMEGTDCPWWDTLVMATPRANVKQAIGRVLRTHPGKQSPVVLDLVDTGGVFLQFFNKRQKQYYEVKADIVKVG